MMKKVYIQPQLTPISFNTKQIYLNSAGLHSPHSIDTDNYEDGGDLTRQESETSVIWGNHDETDDIWK